MWVDRQGNNWTSKDVVCFLAKAVGSAYLVADLERSYKRGQIYQNGSIWFQRLV